MTTMTQSQSMTNSKRFVFPRQWIGFARTALLYVVILWASMFFLFPLVWMVGTSLKTIEEVQQPQLNLLPSTPQWGNYARLFADPAFQRSYLNSVFLIPVILFGTVSSISLVSYSFSRLRWKGRDLFFALMMGTLMLPYQATLIPQYVMFNELDWIRTFNPITLPGFFAGGASLIFLLRQFMLGIPRELDEAAMVDGANPIQIWWYVVMPLCRPALAAVTVLLTVGSWNSLVQPLIYLQRSELFTMPIYVAGRLNLQESPIPWNDIMAASVMFVAPVLVLFMLTQRYFVEGITFTGSKEG
jgi:multiple sugar transport system permease protein